DLTSEPGASIRIVLDQRQDALLLRELLDRPAGIRRPDIHEGDRASLLDRVEHQSAVILLDGIAPVSDLGQTLLRAALGPRQSNQLLNHRAYPELRKLGREGVEVGIC